MPQPTPQKNIQQQASRAASRIGYQPPPPSMLPAIEFYQYARQQQHRPTPARRIPVEEIIQLLYGRRNRERLLSALDLESPAAKRLLDELRAQPEKNDLNNNNSES